MTTLGVERVAGDLTKQISLTPVNGEVFDDSQASYMSAEMDCDGYRKFLLRIRLAVANAPTNIVIHVYFSQGGDTYEKYVRGPFGSLLYEDSAGGKAECIDGDCLGAKMKIAVTANGVSDVNTFTMTCKVIFTR